MKNASLSPVQRAAVVGSTGVTWGGGVSRKLGGVAGCSVILATSVDDTAAEAVVVPAGADGSLLGVAGSAAGFGAGRRGWSRRS